MNESNEKTFPSDFMRRLRPEYYSDTRDRTTYQLDAATLEYHLQTVTARNQTHDFEVFCRKLCERAICPNLKPSTGPEGGGDSKADTETIPIADEIQTLSYVGEPNAGRERWAFAFSAKKTWAKKIRGDVAGIVATNRGYQKIYCVTSQFARAKDRAKIEDELSRIHAVRVTILDRAWIVEQIIDKDRKDLAFNYLSVGQEVTDARRLGPTDYSRSQQLEDIEKAIADPQRFVGMERQRATEALVVAKLSRNLERPRVETEGRFARAIRFANADGSYRQRLEASYEKIWTGFWWFDDFALLNDEYEAFQSLALETDQARNLEFLCNLTQLLFNAVIHGHLTSSEAKLAERVPRLTDRLAALANEIERPNNALEARMSLLLMQSNQAAIDRDPTALAALWPQLAAIVEQAKGLGEFDADRLSKLVEIFGNVAAKDSGYARLVDQMAAFVSERKSEGEGALVLLKRAQQLDLDDRFEIIRLLGKAAYQLTKREYIGSLIQAMGLLSVAYRSAGLLWAARASSIFAISSIFVEAEEDGDVPASVVPALMLLAWIAVELRHLPDAMESIRLARGCIASLPLTEESKELAEKRLVEFDMVLASHIMNLKSSDLEQVGGLPDVLGGLELLQSRLSLLYVLGHEQLLRDRGAIPSKMASNEVAEFYTLLASQPASDNLREPVIFNKEGMQIYGSSVLGVKVEVHHTGSEAACLAAEAVIGSIEALFATTIDLEASPHVEAFSITIDEIADISEPAFSIDSEQMNAIVRWPSGHFPAAYGQQNEVRQLLVGLAGSIFAATCLVRDMKGTFERFFSDDAVLHRIAMITVAGNSHSRLFGTSVSRIGEWMKLSSDTYPIQSLRPSIVRRRLKLEEGGKEGKKKPAGEFKKPPPLKDHRDLSVRSVIDVHLWDRAGWCGTAFADWGPRYPPAIALLFTDVDAGKKIFERWGERFGPTDKDDEIYVAIVRGIPELNPAHYCVLLTSRLPPADDDSGDRQFMFACRLNTMQPETDANLAHFLEVYGRAGAYLLLPSVLGSDGKLKLITELAILKKKLSVKMAPEVGKNDIESIALRRR